MRTKRVLKYLAFLLTAALVLSCTHSPCQHFVYLSVIPQEPALRLK